MDGWRQMCCWLYNTALEQRIVCYRCVKNEICWDKYDNQDRYEIWRQRRNHFTNFGQTKQLTELRDADPYWSAVPVEVQRSALRRLDRAYAAFFRRVQNGEEPGFPRFRSVRRYSSFDLGRVKITKNRVHVPKLGHVKMNLYRPIEGTILNATIKRDATGKWWISFQCDLGPAPEKCEIKSSVGIDLGLETLAISLPRTVLEVDARRCLGSIPSVLRFQSGRSWEAPHAEGPQADVTAMQSVRDDRQDDARRPGVPLSELRTGDCPRSQFGDQRSLRPAGAVWS